MPNFEDDDNLLYLRDSSDLSILGPYPNRSKYLNDSDTMIRRRLLSGHTGSHFLKGQIKPLEVQPPSRDARFPSFVYH